MSYKSPFVDLPSHWKTLRGELVPVIEDVLSRGQVIMRDELVEFENAIASFCGTRYAVGLNSCTDAMMLALKALRVGSGDEVITVGHTFVATVASIIHCGAKPVLVDVRIEDHLMDVSLVENAVSSRTKAIIPVHLNGRLCDMEALSGIAEKHHLHIVEDAAQALGASHGQKHAGSFGAAGAFSLYPMKMLGAFGDGGVLTTDDEEVYRTVRFLRDHGQDRTTGEVLMYGFNSRLDNLQAALLSVKLRHFPDWIERRREIASMYQEGLKGLPQVVLPRDPQADSHVVDVFQNYVIRSESRDLLAKHLEQERVETLISWPVPLHHQGRLGLNTFRLPVTEELSRTVLSLPMNPEVTNDQAHHTIKAIKSFFT